MIGNIILDSQKMNSMVNKIIGGGITSNEISVEDLKRQVIGSASIDSDPRIAAMGEVDKVIKERFASLDKLMAAAQKRMEEATENPDAGTKSATGKSETTGTKEDANETTENKGTISEEFNENEYLENKVSQLNRISANGRSNWTVGEVRQAITDAGMNPQEHYESFGKAEGVLPNAQAAKTFNENEYFAKKTAQLNSSSAEGKNNWSINETRQKFEEAGLSAWEHYLAFGKDEGIL